jgi:molybdopterin molybdotransferase
MLAVEEAFRRITAAFEPLPSEWVTLPTARGRVLAEDLIAARDLPPRAVSAMDGYAVRSDDLKGGKARLRLIGEAPAGGHFEGQVRPGETVRILTGGPLPDGADAVALPENAAREGDQIDLEGEVAAGSYVRPAGLDVKRGSRVLPAGKLLTARDLGLAAGLNSPWLRVRRRPRIALLATGDELVRPGEPVGPDQIVSSNSTTLKAMVEAWGADAVDLGIIADRQEAFAEALPELSGVDLVVTLGGASVGERDLVRQVLGERGLELDFWQIAMRPGKPLMFGQIAGTPLLGLPGNPVSSGVCAVLFVRSVIRTLQGVEAAAPEIPAVLGAPLEANDRRQDYLRATWRWLSDGRLEATASKRQDSSMFQIFAGADCLIKRAPHAAPAPAGSAVVVLPLGPASIGV